MSLFPAYTENVEHCEPKSPETLDPTTTTQWLKNKSFKIENETILKRVQTAEISLCSSQSSDSDNSSAEAVKNSTEIHKNKCKKRKNEAATHDKANPFEDTDFYIDTKPNKSYKSVHTLYKPACPRYRKFGYRCLGWRLFKRENARKPSKRYYHRPLAENREITVNKKVALLEEDYNNCSSRLNRHIMQTADNLQYWFDLIELQERNPYKWSRLLLAEKQLDLLERALTHHSRSECLYRLYINIINVTYPSFEVSKTLDKLLARDPYNYTLWTAQIMTTQGTMARCIVPDVLHIYARCMQKMHHNARKRADDTAEAIESDRIMLKLFYNCALFLRQAGLMEKFFALIKLALELNVSTDLFGDFAPTATDQRTLIEYEELVLQSGLPLNEIWSRIEKLRQCFNFLPSPINAPSSDPQRIVFNEDVCHYIYPLKQRKSSFQMLLLIIRLLKVPFVQTDTMAELFNAHVENMGDSDAIEDILAICNRRTFVLPAQQHEKFVLSLYEMCKEMAVTPTYINNSIAYEIYTRFLSDFLLNSAAVYAGIDERRRLIFLLLWCRFQRMLLVLERLSGKLTESQAKAGRQLFKTLLKETANRNCQPLFMEFAIYEYERAPKDIQNWKNIFENIITTYQDANNTEDKTKSQAFLCQLYLTYSEILVAQNEQTTALQVLCCYALKLNISDKTQINAAKQLLAFQRLSSESKTQLTEEESVEEMSIEDYLLPDYTIYLLRMISLFQYLLEQKQKALEQLEKWLKSFRGCVDTARQRFMCEQLHETYITLAQLPAGNCVVSLNFIGEKLFAALQEFPRNLFLLQQCGMLANSMPWYKIRSAALRNTPTAATIIILIAITRQRYFQMLNENFDYLSWFAALSTYKTDANLQHAEHIVRNRVLDMFNFLAESATQGQQVSPRFRALQRNALFWRLYLRCLSDKTTNFETSQNCLLMALDECPWNKSLYLDGATYVPQELPKLQDLIIEKQLRICALPEELEILRE